jgi:hypothetical protein
MSIVPFEIKSIDLVADWNYDCENSNCGYCEKSLYKSSIIKKVQESSVSRYECSHAFHQNCIKKWLRSNNRCPMCNCENFKFDKMLNMKSHIKLFKK